MCIRDSIKSLLLGSAAALLAVSGARAADAVVVAEPEPMEYVRICDVYGAGFYYIPGTETCLKVSGYVRYDIGAGALGHQDVLDKNSFEFTPGADITFRGNKIGQRPGTVDYDTNDTWHKRTRFALRVDARSETELGTLRAYAAINFNYDTTVNDVWLSDLVGDVEEDIFFGGVTGTSTNIGIEHAYIEPEAGTACAVHRFAADRGPRPRRPVRCQGPGRTRPDPDSPRDPERDPPCHGGGHQSCSRAAPPCPASPAIPFICAEGSGGSGGGVILFSRWRRKAQAWRVVETPEPVPVGAGLDDVEVVADEDPLDVERAVGREEGLDPRGGGAEGDGALVVEDGLALHRVGHLAHPAVQWPMVQQRVYASVQGGPYQLATVLDVNKQTAMIHIRLDAGGDGWVPASHLRALT